MGGTSPNQFNSAATTYESPGYTPTTTPSQTTRPSTGKGGGYQSAPTPQRYVQPQVPTDPYANSLIRVGGLQKSNFATNTQAPSRSFKNIFEPVIFSDFTNTTTPPPPPPVISDPGGPSVFDTSTPTSGALDTGAGTSLSYSNPGEYENAVNIQQVIKDGGVNPETGDNNIVAGPNVLSASDDSALNFGSDYNDQFQENYAAQSAHAEANPYGQSTGTPLYEQGFATQGGIGDTLVNNGLFGSIASGLTGKELLPTTSNYLPPPPVEDTAVDGFQGIYSGGGADGVGNLGKVGDFFGGIGDSLGITNYSGENTAEVPAASTYTPPSANPNQAAADFHASITSGSNAQEKAESAAQAVKNKTKADFFNEFGSSGKEAEQAWINDENKRKNAAIAAAGSEQAWLNAGAKYNTGGRVRAGK